MRISNYNKPELIIELTKRIKEISCRERIVLQFPFNSDINRIEFYCSEALVKSSSYSGTPFPGIFSIQVFEDNGNKPGAKSSYSYVNDFLKYLPTLVNKCFEKL